MITKIILDLSDKYTADTVHPYLKDRLNLPEHYGQNLDALYDCLTDMQEPTCLGIFNINMACKYHAQLLQVLKDAESDNQNLCVIYASRNLNQ